MSAHLIYCPAQIAHARRRGRHEDPGGVHGPVLTLRPGVEVEDGVPVGEEDEGGAQPRPQVLGGEVVEQRARGELARERQGQAHRGVHVGACREEMLSLNYLSRTLSFLGQG